MAIKSKARTQAARDKKSLRKLRELGLLTAKADLRRKPSKYQKSLLSKFSDVLNGKAAVVKPKNPTEYKGIFRVQNGRVVVPRRKGETIKVDKKGRIAGERKDASGRKIKSRIHKVPRGDMPARQTGRVQYVIPFITRGGEINWMRWPNYDELKKFMEGYNYKDWPNYVVTEKVDEELSDEELQDKLDEKRLKVQIRRAKRKSRR